MAAEQYLEIPPIPEYADISYIIPIGGNPSKAFDRLIESMTKFPFPVDIESKDMKALQLSGYVYIDYEQLKFYVSVFVTPKDGYVVEIQRRLGDALQFQRFFYECVQVLNASLDIRKPLTVPSGYTMNDESVDLLCKFLNGNYDSRKDALVIFLSAIDSGDHNIPFVAKVAPKILPSNLSSSERDICRLAVTLLAKLHMKSAIVCEPWLPQVKVILQNPASLQETKRQCKLILGS